jgi:hypothetical protein
MKADVVVRRLVDEGRVAAARGDSESESADRLDDRGAAYPVYTNVRQAAKVHKWAMKAKVGVRTGVNPGFVMDSLPIALTAACQRVDRISVTRIQARSLGCRFSRRRRRAHHRAVSEASKKAASNTPFTESIAMIADSLSWTLDGSATGSNRSSRG